ncbi:MAG: hypothetical protein AAB495_04675 [Patescibacteria group bacterium]
MKNESKIILRLLFAGIFGMSFCILLLPFRSLGIPTINILGAISFILSLGSLIAAVCRGVLMGVVSTINSTFESSKEREALLRSKTVTSPSD